MVDRRRFLAGVGAAAVLGFDPASRSWVTSAAAAAAPLVALPHLDGTVVSDPGSLAAAATDAGNIIHRIPIAVLRPGSAEDVARMVRYCRQNRIKVAARGQGHTTFGQAQVDGGLVIEMSFLDTIYGITDATADVAAGVQWRNLLLAALAQGLTPPVLTGFTQLSVGGTLSVGGISSTNSQGAQVDRVRRLQVVTGEGDIRWCSARDNRDLFEAVLAGLGQYAIITRAVVDLVPAKESARVCLLTYTDNATFFRDIRTLLRRGEFDDVFTLWFPNPSGGWIYQLNAVKMFDAPTPPDTSRLLRGLTQPSSAASVSDSPFVQYALRVDGAIDFFKSIGLWDGVAHPWFDAFLPDSTVERYVGEVLPTLTPEDVGETGFMLLFPQRRSKLTRPLFRVPDCGEWVFLFDILTAAAAPGPNTEFVNRMLTRNRALFEKARLYGGTRYPIGSTTFTHRDWVVQYGDEWRNVVHLKHRFDPDQILTPGPGIF